MYSIVVLTIVAAVASAEDMDPGKCRNFVHPNIMRCCSKVPNQKGMPDELKECFELARDPSSCAREECIGKKKGFLTSDGKIIKEKLVETFAAELEGETDLLDAVKAKCLDGDLEKYGPPEFCDLVKMRHCVSIQFIQKCPEWSDKDNCKGVKESMEECAKFYS